MPYNRFNPAGVRLPPVKGLLRRLATGSDLLVLCCATLLWLMSGTLQAGDDRLSLPALPSSLASRSLLLDIDEQGGLLSVVGERGHILISENDGRDWKQAEVPVSTTLTAVDFADRTHGWAVGHDGLILASQDGGQRWQKQLDGNRLNQMVLGHYRQLRDQAETQLQQVVAAGGDEEDAEARLEQLDIALEDAEIALEEGPTKPFLDLLFADARLGWAVGAYGLMLETRDGGRQWQPVMERLDNPDGFHLNVMLQTRNGALFIAGEAGLLFRSLDQGQSWLLLDSPYEGSFYGLLETATGAILVTGLRGRGYRSDDGGDSWRELDMATRATLNDIVQLPDGALVAVGNSGALTYSDSGSAAFRQRLQPGLESYSAAVAVASEQLILVGQRGITRLPVQQLREALK